jgi:hypothetical protein
MEALMENIGENTQQQGRSEPQPQYGGLPRKAFLRDDSRYKSPTLATILSLMPGLGQIYVGYYQQGFINIVVIAGIISLLASDRLNDSFTAFFGLFLAFYWLYNMVDAYRKCIFYNQALAGLGPFELPEGEQFPGPRGSLAGGVFLIIVGGIALGYTRFGLPLGWIEHWWPLALILMGAWLLFQSIRRKSK